MTILRRGSCKSTSADLTNMFIACENMETEPLMIFFSSHCYADVVDPDVTVRLKLFDWSRKRFLILPGTWCQSRDVSTNVGSIRMRCQCRATARPDLLYPPVCLWSAGWPHWGIWCILLRLPLSALNFHYTVRVYLSHIMILFHIKMTSFFFFFLKSSHIDPSQCKDEIRCMVMITSGLLV